MYLCFNQKKKKQIILMVLKKKISFFLHKTYNIYRHTRARFISSVLEYDKLNIHPIQTQVRFILSCMNVNI